jgi:hypothetical protein
LSSFIKKLIQKDFRPPPFDFISPQKNLSEKIAGGFPVFTCRFRTDKQQAGKKRSEAESRTELALVRGKGRMLGNAAAPKQSLVLGKNFCPPASAPKARLGWEAFPQFCVSRISK